MQNIAEQSGFAEAYIGEEGLLSGLATRHSVHVTVHTFFTQN